ncbi:flagellar hook-basal body complex protein [Opitutales bacterium ASA1]|uniref:flagellar hook-basal body complex protein n=1 Tax=Congregicoccus parvus TaxID=3081749 RepID=UPI002B2839A6|nr:flagellar hook-basal body complex protein [Opitutales bacterium ASA1]
MALIGSLNSGISALRNFARGLEVIGNNIANVNSTAFKGSRTKYTDSFSQYLRQPAASPSDGNGSNSPAAQIGLGVQIAGIQTSFLQGGVQQTGQNTDLAISGNGFFQVRNSQSNQFFATRAGDFRVDDRGYLTTNDGYRLQGLAGGYMTYEAELDTDGELVITGTFVPADEVGDLRIDFDASFANGRLTNSTGDTSEARLREILDKVPKMTAYSFLGNGNLNVQLSNGESFVGGKVLLMNFSDPTALVREGANLFSGFDAAGVIGGVQMTEENNSPGNSGYGVILGGALELSNVDLTEQFAEMITTQRSFQAGSRIITISDEVLQEVVNLKR